MTYRPRRYETPAERSQRRADTLYIWCSIAAAAFAALGPMLAITLFQ